MNENDDQVRSCLPCVLIEIIEIGKGNDRCYNRTAIVIETLLWLPINVHPKRKKILTSFQLMLRCNHRVVRTELDVKSADHGMATPIISYKASHFAQWWSHHRTLIGPSTCRYRLYTIIVHKYTLIVSMIQSILAFCWVGEIGQTYFPAGVKGDDDDDVLDRRRIEQDLSLVRRRRFVCVHLCSHRLFCSRSAFDR